MTYVKKQGGTVEGAGDHNVVRGSFGSSQRDTHPGRIMSWQIRWVAQTRSFPQSGHLFTRYSTQSVSSLVTLIGTCLLWDQAQSYLYTCLWFWIPWLWNRMPFSIHGTMSVLTPYPLRPSTAGIVKSDTIDMAPLDSSWSVLASKGEVRQSIVSSGGRTSRAPRAVELFGSATCQEVPLWPGDAASSRMKIIKHLVREVVEVIASDLRGLTVSLY